MATRQGHKVSFVTVRSEGSILPYDLLQRIVDTKSQLDGLSPESYHLSGERITDAINRSWNRLTGAWNSFQTAAAKLSDTEPGTSITRERFLLPLFQELGYGRLTGSKFELEGKSYPISHAWQHSPIHLVGCNVSLEVKASGVTGASKVSPHGLVQDFLNRSDDHLWGFVSNGRKLRILRDNSSLTRQPYVEFDLEAMMNGEVYSDFVLLWLLCHESRVEAEKPEQCWLERWSRWAQDQGTRALDRLREGVETAIRALGSGFLAYKGNQTLRDQLRDGIVTKQEYFQQLLRIVYRLIFLFVAEDRKDERDRSFLFVPDATDAQIQRYEKFYSTARIRRIAFRHRGTVHVDLWKSLQLVFEKLGSDQGCPELGLPALGSFLWRSQAIPALAQCEIDNRALLDAFRALAYQVDGKVRRIVSYKELGSEELGSIYESLLELHPDLNTETGHFEIRSVAGSERKTTGSYYTPTSLITCLLDSALDPVLDEAAKKANPVEAIFNLKVCDPACGSGHFLVAASHRIAKRLASIRSDDDEPSPTAVRSALRDVIGHCLYGVDINPMAVELCKVSLWMEALEPGKPLSFLDSKIQCGNSLLGTTPKLMADGIPDEAFTPIEGDDKKACSAYKKKNKEERTKRQESFLTEAMPWERLGNLPAAMLLINRAPDTSIEDIHQKEQRWAELVHSTDYANARLLADSWCASYVWKKLPIGQWHYPITEAEFRKLERNPNIIHPAIREEIQHLAQQYNFFHWHLAFPDVFRLPNPNETPDNEQTGWCGGFDVVLGNPPWERIKLQEKEFFAPYRPDIANAANASERSKRIEALNDPVHGDPALYTKFKDACRSAEGESIYVRNSGRFPLCGRGDVNTYAVFAENMRTIQNATGRAGIIVPSGIATDDTTKFFFQDLMDSASLVSLFDFENREKLFPAVDSRMKFCLLTMTGSLRPSKQGADFVFFALQAEHLHESNRHFSLTAKEIALLNPNTRTCPIFRSKADAEVTKAIYNSIPVLVHEGNSENPWDAYYMRFVHLGDHKEFVHLALNDHKSGFSIPLYESKLMWFFDHRFATFSNVTNQEFIDGQPRELSQIEKLDPNTKIQSRYEVSDLLASDLFQKYPKHTANWVLIWRDVTNTTNERTAICSIIPKVTSSVSCPGLGHTPTHEGYKLLSNINSICFDYVARQKTGGLHLNWGTLKQLPILKCADYSGYWTRLIKERVLELTYTAWDLQDFALDCGYDGPPFKWDEERRFFLRCELDAAYFHLYLGTSDDWQSNGTSELLAYFPTPRHAVEYIMETFPIVKKKDLKAFGTFRTKETILSIYDDMASAIANGTPYTTRLDPPPADPRVAHSNVSK